jgi:RNA recognition motif-containing protein
MNAPPYPPQSAPYTADRAQDAEYQRQWDQFLADERQYMSEAKWDRFPEGSRIFIGTRSASGASKNGAHIFSTGNLSSDKVSKRDVFDLFHRFGRLAQISLKSAYGFVQYHSVEEGRRAMENLQGIEIKGRRIRKLTSLGD